MVGEDQEGAWVRVRWGKNSPNIRNNTRVQVFDYEGRVVANGAVVHKLGALLDVGVVYEPGEKVYVGDRVFVTTAR